MTDLEKIGSEWLTFTKKITWSGGAWKLTIPDEVMQAGDIKPHQILSAMVKNTGQIGKHTKRETKVALPEDEADSDEQA